MASLAVVAPAKINLFLHIVGRRADGYHEIDSLIAFADSHDIVRVDHSDRLILAVEGPFAGDMGNEADNLVLRAARALMAASGEARGAAITLFKNLPVASGMGGGSADAAATMRALVSLWQLELGADALAEIGLSLGADVPVCLFGRPARVQGIGEQISPADRFPDLGLVLVNPGVAVSTAEVFAGRQGAYSQTADLPADLSERDALIAALAVTRNDLAAPATDLSPQISSVLDALDAQGDCLLSRLSGSGATCFGLFPDAKSADQAALAIRRGHPDWWVHGGRFLSEAPTPKAVG